MKKIKTILTKDYIRLYGSYNNNEDTGYFNNTTSQVIFSFGDFSLTSNFGGKTPIEYKNVLNSFVKPITLETIGINDTVSNILLNNTVNVKLNFDKSDVSNFVRFGSAYEFLRTTIQKIILNYPASIFVNSNKDGYAKTFFNFIYDSITNTSSFSIPINKIENKFNLIFNIGNNYCPDNNELRNLNVSYNKFVVWLSAKPTENFPVIGFTGYSSGSQYLRVKVKGNPFLNVLVSGTSAPIDFHIKPKPEEFEKFRFSLDDYEKYILSQRKGVDGFEFSIREPVLLEDGNIIYSTVNLVWTTSDGYNLDIDGSSYGMFLDSLLTIGKKYDIVKTDLIVRLLTPMSIKQYDLTENGKMTKLLRLYGREFDEIRKFIDSLTYINKVSYDKINNIPDQLVKNLARTLGWDSFTIINEEELVESIFSVDGNERNLLTDLTPPEIDIELWRRILINTLYFWKSKGTREAIKSIFLLIGIPEEFINITEYVYTVKSKINPNTVSLTEIDFPSNSLPYDQEGYPCAPLETDNFYFQINGDVDSGQAYMDVFRKAGFELSLTVDNKKSWVFSGDCYRYDDTTPQYHQKDSRLVLNTKEVDISLDTSRGIEYDVFDYIKNIDFPYNSTGFTLPYLFVNLSLEYTGKKNIFYLPFNYDILKIQGDLEVRYNGILLNGAKVYTGGTETFFEDESNPNNAIDYIVSGNTIRLLNEYATNNNIRRDVIQVSFIYKTGASPISGITVEYNTVRIGKNLLGVTLPLPSKPAGDVQVTINGIALTKTTSLFNADYNIDYNNNQIIIQNTDIVNYFLSNPEVQVAYVQVIGTNDIYSKCESLRVDSFTSSKFYYNDSANRNVYRLNYKTNDAKNIKILIDGIALEPNKDYIINPQNNYEVFLPKKIRYGSVISVYYLVTKSVLQNSIIDDIFKIGDISKLSFLEFIGLIEKRLINVRNRKTISDFKGGWYPTLLNVYLQYLKRGLLDSENPLHSNAYTFNNLYSFLGKYNLLFQKFIDQLLSSTIILRKSGLLIRNSIFNKQKFTYKRGVNLYKNLIDDSDIRGHYMYQYLGDDGSEFVLLQEKEPKPIEISLNTKSGQSYYYPSSDYGYISNTGGENIIGYELVDSYGMKYRINESGSNWNENLITGSLSTNSFNWIIDNLEQGKEYEYRAVIKAGGLCAEGESEYITIPIKPSEIIPTLSTCVGTMDVYSINNTGGIISPSECGDNVQWYGMQYRAIGTVGEVSLLKVTPTELYFDDTENLQKTITICSNPYNKFIIVKDSSMSWVTVSPPEPPMPNGITSYITVQPNTGSERSGYICYSAATNVVPIFITQNEEVPKGVYFDVICTSCPNYDEYEEYNIAKIGVSPSMSTNENFYICLNYYLRKPVTDTGYIQCVSVYCNNNLKYGVSLYRETETYDGGSFPEFRIYYNDDVCVVTCATNAYGFCESGVAQVYIGCVRNGTCGNFCIKYLDSLESITAY